MKYFYFFLAIAIISASILHAKTFSLRIAGDPETLDWNKAHTPVETYLLMNLMEGLIALDDKLKPIPSLASSWTISEDKRTYTFKLKKDIKWSDGVSLKAEHFVYSWKRLLSAVTASSYAYFLFDIEGAEWFNKGLLKDFSAVGIKALDDYTLQIKLARPIAHWIYIPSFWVTFPLRQDIVDAHGTSWDKAGRMVTVGPYILSEYEHGKKMILKSNTYYTGELGDIDQIQIQIISENEKALKLYAEGKLDVLTDLTLQETANFENKKDLKQFSYLKTTYLGFVIKKFPASNINLRRAIARVLNKTLMAKQVLGKVATSFVPSPLLGYSHDIGLSLDISTAKSELRASGLDFSLPLELDVLVPDGDKALMLSKFIEEDLKNHLGIKAKMHPMEHKAYRSQLELKTFPVFLGSWAGDFPDPDNFLSVFLSTSGNNRTSWSQEKLSYDEKITEARNFTDTKRREKNYFQAQKILIEKEVVIIPLVYEPILALVKPHVNNLEINPLNYLLIKKIRLDN